MTGSSESDSSLLLFLLNFTINFSNGLLLPIRESLTLTKGKTLQSNLMSRTIFVSIAGQGLLAYFSASRGGSFALKLCFIVSIFMTLIIPLGILFPSFSTLSISLFYLWFTFYNMTSTSVFWAVAGDEMKGDSSSLVKQFGRMASGGTSGHLLGSLSASFLIRSLGCEKSLYVLLLVFVVCYMVVHLLRKKNLSSALKAKSDQHGQGKEKIKELPPLFHEVRENLNAFYSIWKHPTLFYAFLGSVLSAASLGLTVIERSAAARRSGIDTNQFADRLAQNQVAHGVVQSLLQAFVSSRIIEALGPAYALCIPGLCRLTLFLTLGFIQGFTAPPTVSTSSSTLFSLPTAAMFSLEYLYYRSKFAPVMFVMLGDSVCRLAMHSVSKPLRESIWADIPRELKYRAKVLIDVFAHRIGTSLAAILATAAGFVHLARYAPPLWDCVLRRSSSFSTLSPSSFSSIMQCIDSINIYTENKSGEGSLAGSVESQVFWGIAMALVLVCVQMKMGSVIWHHHRLMQQQEQEMSIADQKITASKTKVDVTTNFAKEERTMMKQETDSNRCANNTMDGRSHCLHDSSIVATVKRRRLAKTNNMS